MIKSYSKQTKNAEKIRIIIEELNNEIILLKSEMKKYERADRDIRDELNSMYKIRLDL